MRLSSVTANLHIIDGQTNGLPLRLLLDFDSGQSLRLQVAADGASMIADNGSLDVPFDMSAHGRIEVSDVTQSLFPQLRGVKVPEIAALSLAGKQVGATLRLADGASFHFWVDGDELHWGSDASLGHHDWLDGIVPSPSERIDI